MSQLSPSQARVIDPILSTIAQGYQNSEMVANYLFPTVPVGLRGGNIITFGKEGFMLYGSQRAPGENTKRVSFGYSGAPYALVDYSLEGLAPVEIMQEAQNGPGIDIGQSTIAGVSDIMALRLEKQAADIARTAASYAAANKITRSGTAQWSDLTTGVSDPINDIENAKDAVRAATGKRPNTVVMGAAVMAKLRQHPKIVDRIKYTGRDVATPELLAALFGVQRVVVGDAIYSNDAGTAFTDVWGKDVVVAYTEIGSMASSGLPSYGYTYQLSGYPQVEEPYFDRNAKSWIYPVTRVEAPVLASALAGYLITNAVA
jgi:Phage major capsid protein E